MTISYQLSKTDLLKSRSDCIVLPVLDGRKLTDASASMDQACQELISAALAQGHLETKVGSTTVLPMPKGSLAVKSLMLVRFGKLKSLQRDRFCDIAAAIARRLRSGKVRDALVCLRDVEFDGGERSWQIERLVQEIEVAGYRFDDFHKDKGSAQAGLRKVTIDTGGGAQAALSSGLRRGQAIASGINHARRLGDLPGNVCTPSFLAAEARKLARGNEKLKCSVLSEARMRELGMHSLLSVSQGSEQEAKLIVLEYQGGRKNARPEVLVGKGITFDTGGISLKPGASMDEMKYDMCGAASVLGTMTALAASSASLNVVGIIAAAENMPSGRATRPGDIVTTMSGQSVEILNTDAEGRLVLCDALTYAERFKPAHVIDIATLTGACVVALGKVVSGLFTQDDELAERLLAAGQAAHDRTWRLPLLDDYQDLLKSNFADMANIGGPYGGAITAACFLSRFTKAYPWAHLDIAGVAWKSGAEKGATGRPVGLLTRYLLDRA